MKTKIFNILFLLLSINLFAEGDFNKIDEITKEFSSRDRTRAIVMTGVSTGFAYVPIVGGGLSKTFDVLDKAAEWNMNKELAEQYQYYLYKIYLNDSKFFKSALEIKNDVDRAKTIFSKISDLDDYHKLIPGNPKNQAIYNSYAIEKIIEVTKALGAENVEQSKAIEELQTNYNSLQKKLAMKEGGRTIASLNENITSSQLEFQKAAEKAKKALSTIDNLKSTDIINENDPKLKTKAVEQFAYNYNDFNESLQKGVAYAANAYQMAVNLGLHGSDQEKVAKGLQYFAAVATISNAIVKQDPQSIMQAGLAITSLFGHPKGQEDLKHKEIMEAFGQMFEMQRAMLKNQAEMYALEVKNYELISSLYQMSQSKFVDISDGLDIILGNEAVLQKSIVDYSNLAPNLEACDIFLNSRFSCPPSELEDHSNISKCIKRISKTNFEIPNNTFFMSTIFGNYNKLDDAKKHLTENYDDYLKCQKGMSDLFASTSADAHSAFLVASTIDSNQTGYQQVVAKTYAPLTSLVKKLYSTDVDAYTLYSILLAPSTQLNQFSFKLLNASSWYNSIDSDNFLTKNQVYTALDNLIYVPNFEKYALQQIQMINYSENIKKDSNGDLDLNPNFITSPLVNSKNKKIADRLFNLEKIVNIAIAQQTLLSGQPFLELAENYISKSMAGTSEQELTLKLIKNNGFFRINFLKQLLRNVLGNSIKKDLSYSPEYKTFNQRLAKNIEDYEKYRLANNQECNSSVKKEDKCKSDIYNTLSQYLELKGNKIIFKDYQNQTFQIELPEARLLKVDSIENTAELKQLYKLRSLLEEIISKSDFFFNFAINQNYYTF
jgi:hypothetical protein